MKLRLLEGPLYIYALQEILNQVKQLFIIQLEKGAEVPIPKQLRQSELPMSYQFYNCLFGYISHTISMESKNFILNGQDEEGNHKGHRAKGASVSQSELNQKEVKLSEKETFNMLLSKASQI